MSYGNKIKQRKNKKSQPKGRESWKGAINQARGNIRWMIENFKVQEIVTLMAEETFKQEKNIHPAKERLKQIKMLSKYFSKMEQQCKTELSRIEKVTEFDDSTFDEEVNTVDNLGVHL
jgi:hypothetical protein